MDSRNKLLITILSLLVTVQAVYHGCYQESVRRRHFSISPGDYIPELMTQSSCASSCGDSNYGFAALTLGKFCYCANTLPLANVVNDAFCDVTCVGNPNQKCGGSKYVSVFSSTEEISGLSLMSDATGKIISVAVPVTFSVNISSGNDAIYKFDYGDGSDITGPNTTNMLTTTYYTPGEYLVMVYANDVNQTFQNQVAATAVRVDAPPGQMEIECEPVFGTFEEGNCTCVVWWGSSLSLAITVSTLSISLSIEDPPLSLAGPAVNEKNAVIGSGTQAVYLLQASEFSVSGRIIGWEMVVSDRLAGSNLIILLLKPGCSSGTYCYSSNSCSSSCVSSSSRVTSCPTGEQFCIQAAMCQPTCTVSSRYPSSATNYEIVQMMTLTTTTAGYQYIPDTSTLPIVVQPGYVLGIKQDIGQAVLSRLSCTTDQSDQQFTYSDVQVGSKLTLSGSVTNNQHAFRAVSSGGSKVSVPLTFDVAGNFTLSAVAASTTLTGRPSSQTNITVVVFEGVNTSTVIGPDFGGTGDVITFTVLPHTGNNVHYNWTFSDGFEDLVSTNGTLSRRFMSKGIYLVNVTTFNAVSFKTNFTEIVIEDKVDGLKLEAAPTVLGTSASIKMSLNNGSDYNCTWSFGDQTRTEVTNEVNTPISGSYMQHTYVAAGSYIVSVTCTNNISTSSALVTVDVLEAITNLRMLHAGAQKGQTFSLEWLVDTGTDITWTVVFDGLSITSFNNISKYQWKSITLAARSSSSIPLTITASNAISNANISIQFQILSVIVNPSITTTAANASSHEIVTFTVNMDAGSDVTVTVSYGDSQTDSYSQPSGSEWAGPVDMKHTYLKGGRFTVTATFTNSEGQYMRSLQFLVLVGVAAVDCDMVDYSLYHPPAEVSLTFVASIEPTEPILIINWGERQSSDIQLDLQINTPYNHTYGDTGIFTVKAHLSNLIGQKTCLKDITILEKLSGPSFDQKFPCAAKDKPFAVTFCLYRAPSGNQCNITWDFGNNSTNLVLPRQGAGKNGCDTMYVTYTDLVPKIVKVTATTYLETVSAVLPVTVIYGVDASQIQVTTNGFINFGSNTVIIIQYNGIDIPTAASITFHFGDSSTVDDGPHDFTISSSGVTQQFIHKYQKDGLFNASVILYNNASSVETYIQVGVFQDFSSLWAEVFYLADIPPNAETFGVNGNLQLFPANKPIFFRLSDLNNAFATSYQTKVVNSTGQIVFVGTFSTPVFSIRLTQSDTYIIDITASNPLHSASISSKTIIIIELVEGFSIVEEAYQVRMNEVKVFNISFTRQGTNTCLYVNFGDGVQKIYSDATTSCLKTEFLGVDQTNKQALTGLTQIKHVYTTEGYFTVTATGENSQSSTTVYLSFSITGLDCSKPAVKINNRKNDFTEAAVYKRSNKIQVEGLSEIECAISYDNTKFWNVFKINETFDTIMYEIALTGVDTSAAQLNLPARFLDLGLYRVIFSMRMTGRYGNNKFEASTYTYIKVVKSDLVGVMMPGGATMIQRGTSQILILNPLANSVDQDVAPSNLQGLVVANWTCEMVGNSSGDCSKAGFISTGQTQTLTIGGLMLGMYRIRAYLQKDIRWTSTEILLTVVNGNPPTLSLQPGPGSVFYQLSDRFKILKTSRFTLDCICLSCLSSDSPVYLWVLYLYDYRWPNGWRVLQPSDLDGRVLGQFTKQIAISSDMFDLFDAVNMRVECSITVNGLSGNISAHLQINTPPANGNCTVTPTNRTITTKNAWELQVSGWTDEDGIDGFQFFIHIDSDTVDKQITSVESSDGNYQLQVCLSQGPDYNNYQQKVFVKVMDLLGSSQTTECGVVAVWPQTLDDIRATIKDMLNNKLNELNLVFAEGDQKTCTEKATNFVSLLNSYSKSSETEYAGQKLPVNFVNSMFGQADKDRKYYKKEDVSIQNEIIEYQMESQRNDRSLMRSSLINKMLEFHPQSVLAVTQICSFLAETAKYGDEIDQASQLNVMQALKNMTILLSDANFTNNVPIENIETANQNILAGVGLIMSAAGNNGFFGTQSELLAATHDSQFPIYDTSLDALGGPDDLESAADFSEAYERHTARIHKLRQAATAVVVRNQVIQVLDKQAECFASYSVPGQILESNSLKLKQVMKKEYMEDLMGKQLNVPGSIGGVILPNITFLNGIDSGEPVVISVMQTTDYPLRYSNIASSISTMSNFVSINMYGGNNGTKLSVQDLKEPFIVTIPLDENMLEPNFVSINPKITSWSTLMNFVTYINYTQSAICLEFADLGNRKLLLVIKKGKLANIAKNSSDDECDDVRLMPDSTIQSNNDADKNKLCLNNTFTGDFTGRLAVGIRELNTTELDMDVSTGCSSLPRYDNGTDYFRGFIKFRVYVPRCLSIRDSENDWTTNGCVVGSETNIKKTVCYCTHMTTFAGGWVVVPNTIDWSYVFANADFLSNPTIYITVIVTSALYIIFAIMAHYKDKKMAEKLGIAPLADNDPNDKYLYEVLVCTGMRRNAGTNSQVCFIMSGEDDETDVRAFSDSKRTIFRRGQIDGFLMAVPRPLGYLNFMRIWHDNSGRGKFGSWYLNYIIVRDIQTDAKQLFIANRWFAVEEDDGQVDRVIPAANQEQMSDFSYQFGERSRKNFADGHLWFSVVARPPQSRFTCLQRISCCLCLLFVTMLANAMFYNTGSNTESASNSFSFGPFSIAPEQIFIGVVSNLIVFPINFLLVYLFKKARPHHKRPSRIDMAIQEVQDQGKQTNINDIRPEVSSIFSVSKTPRLPKDPRHQEMSASRPGTAMSNTSTEELTPNKKKKKFELPWYFRIIAWLLLWVITLGAMALVIFYGISFQDDVCKKWITSMLVSFFMSVFVTQPVKVILFAIILSLIVKNPGEEKEDEEEDEELPIIDQDGELLHGDMSAIAMTRPRKIGYKPPDPQLLEKLREKRLKEIKMWAIIREVIVYSFFLWILMVISYRQMGASNFLYKNTLHKVFIENKQTNIDFNAIRNTDEFWTWATSGMVNGIRAGPYYNDYPPLKLRAYINDKVSRIIGYATMRQLRIKPGQCDIPKHVKGIIQECNVAYSMFDQEERSFMPGWKPMKDGDDTSNMTRKEYTYTTAETLNGYPYWGILSWYSGGGYVVPLKGSKEELIIQMKQLQEENWIDRYTRAVFVEFTVYNPQVNLFAISTILAELHPSGGTVTSVRFEPAMLLPYMTSAMLFQIVCEIVYILFALFFIVRELRELFKTKCQYFCSFWNLVEIGIISMSVAAIVIFFYRLIVTNKLTKEFKNTHGNGYVKFQYVGYWNETFSYMIGFLCFLATIKFLKLLRFNRKMSMLSSTLKFSAWSLIHFGIIFLIVFLAFSQLFYLTFMHIDVDYATFVASMVAGILMMMGKYDIYSMIMAEPVLTQIFVLVFVITVTFILVNMFVTILNESFSAVREDINKQGNDYEVVNFMLQRFKQWTGLGGSENDTSVAGATDDTNDDHRAQVAKNTSDHVQDFPDRIERLLQTISSVYMDSSMQENLAQLYQKKPYESQAGSKNLLTTGLTSLPASGHNQKRKSSSDIVARVHTH